ncbi:hypothetical protein KUTeg_006341 [Tegillarca granosa]|uniref:C-type lectin domain-containing protein n=1 Tax=Tegillarca granosa TaxID=220873 RepID=A0ABQ9FG69_TEGGR|nr:hypothetical protein KUTeg_006341 [Tegillarca granosa]
MHLHYTDYKTGIWLDGNDLNNEGKWIWSYNNEPIKLTYWHPNEPNGKRRENCLMIHKFNGKWKWNDESCKTPLYFACQKKMQASSEKQCLSTKDLLDELIKCKKTLQVTMITILDAEVLILSIVPI